MVSPRLLSFQLEQTGQPVRIDAFLSHNCPDISRTIIQKLIKIGHVSIDGASIQKSSVKVLPGQTCECKVDEEILNPPTHLRPFASNLDIIYEDKEILVINKQAGMSVHPGAGNKETTLANALIAYAKELSDVGGFERPGIVHRLDKGTSGIILIAKTNKAHLSLSTQFSERKVKKQYWALTWGDWKEPETLVDKPIGRDPKNRKKMSVNQKGRSANTLFKTIKAYGYVTEVAVFPETGRTHQIRVHASTAGHPVLGDAEYGGGVKRLGSVAPAFNQSAKALLKMAGRLMLHATKISFVHPTKNKRMSLEAPFPEDIKAVKALLKLM